MPTPEHEARVSTSLQIDSDCPGMDVNVNDTGTPGPQPPVSSCVDDVSVPPAWLMNTMLGYLCGVSEGKAWQELLKTFFKFEVLNTTIGVCS